MPSNINAKLMTIQSNLRVEKAQWNDFSKFYYRSKEDIVEAAKLICYELNMTLTCTDEAVCLENGWVYIKATATLTDCETGESVNAQGLAREPESKKGMDASQITGTAASYAGKRALGNLFAIDDTKDADRFDAGKTTETARNKERIAVCESCGARYIVEPDATIADMNLIKCCASPNYTWE